MDSFHSHMLKLAATHVRYTNDHMRSTHHHSVYQKEFVFRRILPSVRINTDGFLKYGLDPGSLIGNLGWEGRVQDGCFSTFVEGHHIFVTPQLLTQVLGIPSGGLPIFDESDFSRVHYSNSQHPGDLPFGPAISFLLTSLGIPLGSKFSADSPLDIFRPSFALREVGWHLSSFVVDSGGVNHSPVQDLSLSDDEEENQLVEELERALQIEEALAEAASDID
ncbi:hypothetical protein LINGRAPRIM_LOCUS3262 [Linum grandiflorum]